MTPDPDDLSLEEVLAILRSVGATRRRNPAGGSTGAGEQTWRDDPRESDRDDVLVFLRGHLALIAGERMPEISGPTGPVFTRLNETCRASQQRAIGLAPAHVGGRSYGKRSVSR